MQEITQGWECPHVSWMTVSRDVQLRPFLVKFCLLLLFLLWGQDANRGNSCHPHTQADTYSLYIYIYGKALGNSGKCSAIPTHPKKTSFTSLAPSPALVWHGDSLDECQYHSFPAQSDHRQSDFPTTTQSSSNYNTGLLTVLRADP